MEMLTEEHTGPRMGGKHHSTPAFHLLCATSVCLVCIFILSFFPLTDLFHIFSADCLSPEVEYSAHTVFGSGFGQAAEQNKGESYHKFSAT